MRPSFDQTQLEQSPRSWRLLGPEGVLLLELRDVELDRALLSGFVDPSVSHRSMFEYHRLLEETKGTPVVGESSPPPSEDFDDGFLGDAGIRWD